MRSFNEILQNRIDRCRPIMVWLFSEPQWFYRQFKQTAKVNIPHLIESKSDAKNIFIIIFEVIFNAFKYRCLPFFYFRYGLYLKRFDKSSVARFLPETTFYYHQLSYFNKDWNLLDDKNIFHNILNNSGLKTPRNIIRKQSGQWWNSENKKINCESSIYEILINSEHLDFFCKPAKYSSGGNGVFLLQKKHGQLFCDENAITAKKLEELFEGDWLVQERIINCQELRKFNQYALNCTRILTVRNKEGIPEVLYIAQKIASGKGLTDNGKNGLYYVAVDISTGKLGKYAYNERNDRIEVHPGTDLRYESVTLKDIERATELCLSASYYFPKCNIIGWDVALTENEPVLIEGNSNPALTTIQKPHEGLKELKEYLKINKDFFKKSGI